MYWSPDHRAENAYYVGECPNWVYPREWNRYEEPPWSYAPGRHNQRSAGVHMEAGRVYYVEVLHKQCIGRENLAMGLELANAHDGSKRGPCSGDQPEPCWQTSQFWMPIPVGLFFAPWEADIGFTFTQLPGPTTRERG